MHEIINNKNMTWKGTNTIFATNLYCARKHVAQIGDLLKKKLLRKPK